VLSEALGALHRWMPTPLRPAGLYSTGMEVAEFALRVARIHSGRNGVLGFAGSMHGKSLATAYLGWDNGDGLAVPHLRRLPLPDPAGEPQTLEGVRVLLRTGKIGLVMVEPVQGTSGGRCASPWFYRQLADLARESETLLAYDEVLTGFHRTGPRFVCEAHGVSPDILLFGKACGNGFPVSGIALHPSIHIQAAMLEGSTYSGNPLAASAVKGTLQGLNVLADECALHERVNGIAAAFTKHLEQVMLPERGKASCRTHGALWIAELPTHVDGAALHASLYRAGVCVSYSGRQIRLLPALTIPPEVLDAGLERTATILAASLRQ
jgi:acetylornithine/succinyldiaminopimelate/putrescine aminotransferase